MITLDELKSKLGGFETSINDLRDALAIEASEKRLAELEHQMTLPGFYDDQEKSQKVYAEMSDLKGKLDRFKKLGISPVPLRMNSRAHHLPSPAELLRTAAAGEKVEVKYTIVKYK